MTHANRLVGETSPYLLQHAHNPVDWYPWGDEAFDKARREDKPVLVSIGYAACHWCHVMEKESFENATTAALMNEHFVNIKIDREERPDLDHIYMDAVQVMTGSGGWPLNVFLTPEGKPFYGGTYFPPKPVFNRASWMDVLNGVSRTFREKREEVNTQAENLTRHIDQANGFGQQSVKDLLPSEQLFSKDKVHLMFANIMKNADKEDGGFGKAPKFPQTFVIQYLLHYHYYTGNVEALQQACLSLDKMIRGGIYDQVGGGFARYATDNEWLIPHFEKMLYDNALLVSVISEALQLTGKPHYRQAIDQTLEFIQRELYAPEGGFYSALDADSEGVEGKFYVWSKEEVDALLVDDAPVFTAFFDISPTGNWEHTNILQVKEDPETFAARTGITVEELLSVIDRGRAKLLEARGKRVRPQLDDKILLGWNGLMNIACSKAYAATGNEQYLQLAVSNMEFMLRQFAAGDGSFYHTAKNGVAKYPAFLDDYSCLIQALIQLQEVTGNVSYLHHARKLAEWVSEGFSEEETGFFYFTHKIQQDVIVRKKELYDGAVPSGNAMMAVNLYGLGVIFDLPAWRQRAVTIVSLLHQAVNRYPSSFGLWATLQMSLTYGIPEIAITGGNAAEVRNELLRAFLPFRVLQSAEKDTPGFPLLSQKPYSSVAQLFLCKDYACQQPVNQADGLLRQLKDV
ncbi:MAG: thioredoxin domain-containing protein [Chitinophagaceae bacterium]